MPASKSPFERIAIVGVGMIGGSWGLALKRAGFQGRRVGCDRPEVLRRAAAMGALDESEEDLRRAVAEAELVILAAPVGAILRLLPDLAPAVPPHALVTDTGSTKVTICREARRRFAGEPLFVGGHPLAGKERSGIENADAALFQGTVYVLSPEPQESLSDSRTRGLAALIAAAGARVLSVNPEEHDRAMALLSHLPQLVSTGLASLAGERDDLPLALAAAGFRDMTRLAESPYEVWRDICATNAGNIQHALDALIAKLAFIRDHLSDAPLGGEFERAQRLREHLKNAETGDK
ncbi:MAG: prephenate dehydrogenase [Terriglobia bacterium]